jgi:hypothetical protein
LGLPICQCISPPWPKPAERIKEKTVAKLGGYEFPEFTLLESVALGQRIAREFAGEVSRHGLARSLGMAERGGAFAARVGALRMWAIASGRSRLRVTRDGLRAGNPLSPQEAESARRSLAASVPLFFEIAKRLGGEPYDDARLAVLLEELTGADRNDVKARLATVSRVYSEVRPLLPVQQGQIAQRAQSQEGPEDAGPVAPAGRPSDGARPFTATQAVLANPPAEPLKPTPGRLHIVLPDGVLSLSETVANLDAALTVLWAHRQLVAARQAELPGAAPVSPGPDFVLRNRAPRPHGAGSRTGDD